jgi:8-oxo-dGTP pyrophosphatase MutT (NUDIX family)
MTKRTRILQAAAIPLQDNKICLITSSSGRRWVIPKGKLEPGKTMPEIALQEAWEEAGLTGILHPRPVGSYLYEKFGETYDVTVFVMDVTAVADDWPESHLRQRSWLRPAQAIARIEDPALRALLEAALAGKEIESAQKA